MWNLIEFFILKIKMYLCPLWYTIFTCIKKRFHDLEIIHIKIYKYITIYIWFIWNIDLYKNLYNFINLYNLYKIYIINIKNYYLLYIIIIYNIYVINVKNI